MLRVRSARILPLLTLLALTGLLSLACANAQGPKPVAPKSGAPVAKFLFCTWNVENLFDDKNDKNRPAPDRPYDTGFADNDELRKLKFDHISEALLRMNNGRGPDVIACMEVESIRAAEMLMGSLNAKISDGALKYKNFAMKNLDAGRHIAPCVISRLPLSQIGTRLHGSRLRILETRLVVNNQELTILATHWTSKRQQVGRGGDGESGRELYARTIRGVYTGILKKKPDADVLVCGDFNDTPDAEEVTTDLGAIGDRGKVIASERSDRPLLLDLMANKPGDRFGTLWYDGKPLIYDHICVSPGMLDDNGWGCDPSSISTYTQGLIRQGSTRRQPWRFGDPDRQMPNQARGYADHFPVLVQLTLNTTPATGGTNKPE